MNVNVLRHRPSVHFTPIAPAGFRILAALDAATYACSTDLMITCGSDSHPPGDPHTTGEAYDVSVHTLPVPTIRVLVRYLRQALGPLFTVLYECPTTPEDPDLAAVCYVNPSASGPHLHIQRRKGTLYPPEVA